MTRNMLHFQLGPLGRGFQAPALRLGWAGVLACVLLSIPAEAAPPKRVSLSPGVFGQVFRSTRDAMVRVRWTPEPGRYATGFVIGAEGECLFNAREAPPVALEVEKNGRWHPAKLLGYDDATGFGVARLAEPKVGGRPLTPGPAPDLVPETWVVVVTHGKKGVEPFAGLVSTVPTLRLIRRNKDQKRRPGYVSTVEAPGRAGAPVMSTDGGLVGVVLEGGRRRSEVLRIDSLEPFLRAVVLGR